MNSINKNLQNIIPNNVGEYKISCDNNIANTGIEIWNWLEENNKIKSSHSCNNIVYRWVFGTSGFNSIDYIKNNLPENLSQLINMLMVYI